MSREGGFRNLREELEVRELNTWINFEYNLSSGVHGAQVRHVFEHMRGGTGEKSCRGIRKAVAVFVGEEG